MHDQFAFLKFTLPNNQKKKEKKRQKRVKKSRIIASDEQEIYFARKLI